MNTDVLLVELCGSDDTAQTVPGTSKPGGGDS